jgi:hypothetical protein
VVAGPDTILYSSARGAKLQSYLPEETLPAGSTTRFLIAFTSAYKTKERICWIEYCELLYVSTVYRMIFHADVSTCNFCVFLVPRVIVAINFMPHGWSVLQTMTRLKLLFSSHLATNLITLSSLITSQFLNIFLDNSYFCSFLGFYTFYNFILLRVVKRSVTRNVETKTRSFKNLVTPLFAWGSLGVLVDYFVTILNEFNFSCVFKFSFVSFDFAFLFNFSEFS